MRGGELARIFRFGVVGCAATAAYAALAWSLMVLADWPAAVASLVAWAASSLISYGGHRIYTFHSAGRVSLEAPRFGTLAVFSLMVAVLLPHTVTTVLGLDPALAVILVSLAIPAVSYLAMSRLVFQSG